MPDMDMVNEMVSIIGSEVTEQVLSPIQDCVDISQLESKQNADGVTAAQLQRYVSALEAMPDVRIDRIQTVRQGFSQEIAFHIASGLSQKFLLLDRT